MIEAYRIVEDQTRQYAYKVTGTVTKAEALESALENNKPILSYEEWDILIAAPFRYSMPVQPEYMARFRPPYFRKNLLYCAEHKVTALYEYAYYLLKQRAHLPGIKQKTETRTIFSLYIDPKDIADLAKNGDAKIDDLTDRHNYSASHDFAKSHPNIKVLRYSSCRDPEKRFNYAVFEINSIRVELH